MWGYNLFPYVKADELGIGNSIVTRAGPSVAIESIEHNDESATVYNFEVEDFHTYFVGKANNGLWVHNDCDTQLIVDYTWGHHFGSGNGSEFTAHAIFPPITSFDFEARKWANFHNPAIGELKLTSKDCDDFLEHIQNNASHSEQIPGGWAYYSEADKTILIHRFDKSYWTDPKKPGTVFRGDYDRYLKSIAEENKP